MFVLVALFYSGVLAQKLDLAFDAVQGAEFVAQAVARLKAPKSTSAFLWDWESGPNLRKQRRPQTEKFISSGGRGLPWSLHT